MITDEKKRFYCYRLGILVLVIGLVGCTPVSTPKPDPEVGSTKADYWANQIGSKISC